MINSIIIDDEVLSRKSLEYFIGKTNFVNSLDSFSSPFEALTFLSKNPKIDLIFLDIQMPEMNGIELINTIKNQMPQVILTTSHEKFALEAFEYNVTDYLIKPIIYSRFFKAVSKAKEIHEKQAVHTVDKDIFFIKNANSIIRIHKSDILWVEALGDYVTLNTGEGKFIIHTTMKSVEDKLSFQEYVRVHRSYIVRIDKIDSIEDNSIACGEKLIPIARSYKDAVFKRLNML